MPTLRELVDGNKAVFDAYVSAQPHNRVEAEKPGVRTRSGIRAMAQEHVRLTAPADVNQYVYEAAIMGAAERQEEFNRGYRAGYADGVQSESARHRQISAAMKQPTANALQTSREVDFEE
jgi:hypothetical protein